MIMAVHIKGFYIIVTVGTFFLLAQSTAHAQSSDPSWLEELSQQLAVEQQCHVEYFVNTNEGKLAGMNTYEARAQCSDGRQFDANKIEPAKKFIIRPCGTVVC
jgi:hypothetical protein